MLRVKQDGSVRELIMNRPEKHNAFHPDLIEELSQAFRALRKDDSVRVVLLRGEGRSFSAGADLDWMKSQGEATDEENYESSVRMGQLFRDIDQCPKPVVAVVQGAALGGGAGLVCTADIALAGPEALFGFTEARLGLVAAVISPFVLRRLGYSVTREKLLTGERFGPQEALRIGLVHQVHEDLEEATGRLVGELVKCSPQAQAASKRLLSEIWDLPETDQLHHAARFIADARASTDGREGLSAFLNKRPPQWASQS
ncbi:MAG: enoyl-CoA hydratase-related protein [Vulcanimicrobiota bacterium]